MSKAIMFYGSSAIGLEVFGIWLYKISKDAGIHSRWILAIWNIEIVLSKGDCLPDVC